MTSPATPSLDKTMDAVKEKEDEKTHSDEISSQPQPQEFDRLYFEDYLFPPPPTPSQTNKPSKERGRRRSIIYPHISRNCALETPLAEAEDLDYQPLPVDDLETVTRHEDTRLHDGEGEILGRLRSPRTTIRSKRIKSGKDIEAEVDYSDGNAGRNGGAWSPTGGLNFDIGENSNGPGFNYLSDEIEGGIIVTDAMPCFESEPQVMWEEDGDQRPFPSIQEFGIAQSREDDFNATWFRDGQRHECERQRRDVPGGLIRLAQTSTRTEWRQDEDSSVGATKYPVDAAFHASMTQALSGVKPESTASPERGKSGRMADVNSVTRSLKTVEKVAQSTEKWMKEPQPKKRIRRSRAGKLESTVGELVAE